MLAEAFHIAAPGRPGPVLVDIAKVALQATPTARPAPILSDPAPDTLPPTLTFPAPVTAIRQPSAIPRGISAGSVTRKLCLVIGMVMPQMS
ncbi:hypothetical protein UK12_35105, partial [Saccharothrix sp. ST-888]